MVYVVQVAIWLWIKNLTSQGSQGTDVDCHSFYQMFRPNLGLSSVVDAWLPWLVRFLIHIIMSTPSHTEIFKVAIYNIIILRIYWPLSWWATHGGAQETLTATECPQPGLSQAPFCLTAIYMWCSQGVCTDAMRLLLDFRVFCILCVLGAQLTPESTFGSSWACYTKHISYNYSITCTCPVTINATNLHTHTHQYILYIKYSRILMLTLS